MGVWDDLYDKAKGFLGGESNGQATPQKKCYYDLLEVSRDSSDDEIKRAYRRLALKWHPDKNPARKEECSAYFILIQQAFETLSDPQERAFYDKHRENIIYGSSPEEKRDTGINIYPFIRKCYVDFGDGSEGFYSIYRGVFIQLAAEEYTYIDEEDRDFPTFGSSESDYDSTVGPFYEFWWSYSTQRSFAWLDKHDLRDAPDRYNLKLMEKENKKLRDTGKKQRNEEIRQLVTYVRKRDPRVQKHRAELDARKAIELERVSREQQQRIRENLRKLKEHEVAENISAEHINDLEKIENQLDEEFGRFGHDDDDSHDYYCIVCEKKFKNSKSYSNHQKSNKHREAVAELKNYMTEDDKNLFHGTDDDIVERTANRSKKKKNRKFTQKEEISNLDQATTASLIEDNNTDSGQSLFQKDSVAQISKKVRIKNSKRERVSLKVHSKEPVESKCMICNEEFPSRSKLFAHISSAGHAILKDTVKRR